MEKINNGKKQKQTAQNMNILAKFCGIRDIEDLTCENLNQKYGISQADVFVLFGGSIMCGGDVLAQAMNNRIAKKYVIIGGAGHTTETLRIKIHEVFPDIDTKNKSEAEIFAEYINYRYGLTADYLECESTNCGTNISGLLDLLRENHIAFKSIIIMQDAAIQRRMCACLKKFVEQDVKIINYAAYDAEVIVRDNELSYKEDIFGMWDMERYLSLLLGEIMRLTDDENGYGPRGMDFIVHVDIPKEVKQAYDELCKDYSHLVRKAVS